MAKFDNVVIARTNLKTMRDAMQDYISECSVESDGFVEGLDVTLPALVEALNDILLHSAEGDATMFEPIKEG